jgi:hypothetical protein
MELTDSLHVQPYQKAQPSLETTKTNNLDDKVNTTAKKKIDSINNGKIITKSDYTSIKNEKRAMKLQINTESKRLNSPTKAFRSVFDKNIKNEKSKLNSKIAEYNSLRTSYKELRDTNPSISEAKKISNLMKAHEKSEGKKLNDKFKQEFDSLQEKYGLVGDLTAILGSSDPSAKQEFLANVVDGIEQLRFSSALQERSITWLHGTRSPALGVMLATDKKLHPTGMLLKKNIIPLTGELGIGIQPGAGVNNSNISGTSLSPLGVKITLEYSNSFTPKIANEWKYLSKSNLTKITMFAEDTLTRNSDLESSEWNGNKFDFLKAELYIGRMKVLDPEFSNKVDTLKNEIAEIKLSLIAKNSPSEVISMLDHLEMACDSEPFIEPTDQLRGLVNDSFPIIFGSTSIKGEYAEGLNDLDEHVVSGSVSLKKTQIAFTEDQNVELLQSLIAESGLKIEVMNFNALRILGGTNSTTL